MKRERGHVLSGGRIELRLDLAVPGIGKRMAPAYAIGMQHDVGPIRVFERVGRALELIGVRRVRDEPFVPYVASECAAVFAHSLLAARSCHQPVVPVVLRLAIAQGLVWRVGAVAHRQRHAGADVSLVQRRCDVCGTRTPVMTDQSVTSQFECGGELG